LTTGTYSAGQALFSRTDPRVLLDRSRDTFFKPTEPYEITGQVGNVCFLQGLVYFEGKWLLYYGTADSKIAVADAVGYSYTTIANDLYVSDEEETINEEEEEILHMSEEDSELSEELKEKALRERIFHKLKQRINAANKGNSKIPGKKLKLKRKSDTSEL
jgi:hypothetical protein